jgi:uncharacterized membrane protein YedE/YeeE
MMALAALFCGFVFGWGLLISGMVNPQKVLAFLDLFGAWDPSLAVVMAAALAVSGIGFAVVGGRPPLYAAECVQPPSTGIDAPLMTGAALFGIGWGLVGLCPGPALENLATLSPQVIVFVVAMATGMLLHYAWQKRRQLLARGTDALAAGADG